MKTRIHYSHLIKYGRCFFSEKCALAPFLLLLVIVSGCKNDDFNYGIRPEGQRDFTLKTPKTETTLLLNSGTPEREIVLEWNESKSGLGSEVKYEWLAIMPDGSFESPLITLNSDDEGKSAKLTVTHKRLEDALATAGIPAGGEVTLHWSVKASNPTFSKIAPDPFVIHLERFAEGVSDFNLITPETNTEVVLDEDDPESEIILTWEAATLVNTETVKYKWLAVLNGGSFESPILNFDSDESGTLPKFTITQKALDDALAKLGYKRAEKVNLQWTVIATAGKITETASTPFALSLVRFGSPKTLFLVGSATSIEWDVSKALQMEKDIENKDAYFIITQLFGGKEYKFVTRQEWPGGPGNSTAFGLLNGNLSKDAAAANFIAPPKDGLYWIKVDVKALTTTIQLASMHLVGDATPNKWDVGKATSMIYMGDYKFTGTLQMEGGLEFKFVTQKEWPGGAANSVAYGWNGNRLTTDPSAPNLPGLPSTGIYQVTFDVKTLEYSTSSGGMYLIGAATTADWNVNQALPFDYVSPNKWSITTTLKGREFKFVTKQEWPGGPNNSIAYGLKDNQVSSDPSASNFSSPGPGTYTIVFDQNTMEYTIQ